MTGRHPESQEEKAAQPPARRSLLRCLANHANLLSTRSGAGGFAHADHRPRAARGPEPTGIRSMLRSCQPALQKQRPATLITPAQRSNIWANKSAKANSADLRRWQ